MPEEIFSVNDPQFISEKFDMLLGLNAVKYDQVASFHEASNGALELFFQTINQTVSLTIHDQKTAVSFVLFVSFGGIFAFFFFFCL